MEKPAILVIDDDESITTTLGAFLTAKGYPVTAVNDGGEGLELARGGTFPIIISDIYIDRVSGLDILQAAHSAAVILMTARGSVETTVEAETAGAFEYLAKPFEMRVLLETVERAERARTEQAPEPGEDTGRFGDMVGFAPAIVEVYKRVARFARSDDTVLICGETGVGKELVARAIHQHSARAARPFVCVDAGAIAGTLWDSEIFGSVRGAFTGAERNRPGMVQAAFGGSLFFDEIGEIPLEFQSKLLRLLQQHEYRPVGAAVAERADVRIIAATNRPLERMVREEKFREDLFYRLNVLRIDVPPLRERRSDIPFLIRRFLSGQERIWLAREAEAFLEEHPWPGNVRQLENLIRRVLALCPPGPVSRKDVERALATAEPDEEEPTELDERERVQILRVLEETGGNKTRAAERLGIQRRTLYKKLARMGLDMG